MLLILESKLFGGIALRIQTVVFCVHRIMCNTRVVCHFKIKSSSHACREKHNTINDLGVIKDCHFSGYWIILCLCWVLVLFSSWCIWQIEHQDIDTEPINSFFLFGDLFEKFITNKIISMISMLEFLIDNIFVSFGGTLFQQVVGIPMGTNCAPLLADLFFILIWVRFSSKACKR